MSKFLQQPSQIYKAPFRGHIENNIHRCLATFNYLEYQEDSRKPYRNIQLINDETLAAQQKVVYTAQQNQDVLIIPLVGALDCKTTAEPVLVNTEQSFLFSANAGMPFEIQNPYEKELINFIQIRFDNTGIYREPLLKTFDFTVKNHLFPLAVTDNYAVFTGMFAGREEGTYTPKNTQNGIFAYVIHGAFEFQNRLIESRDGLAISEAETIEFEALSENAILLLFETK